MQPYGINTRKTENSTTTVLVLSLIITTIMRTKHGKFVQTAGLTVWDK